MQTVGSSSDGPSGLLAATHTGDLNCVQPQPEAMVHNWGVNQWMGTVFLRSKMKTSVFPWTTESATKKMIYVPHCAF